jgi:hypothetical protein
MISEFYEYRAERLCSQKQVEPPCTATSVFGIQVERQLYL